jgi:prophage tail gpP-like protein
MKSKAASLFERMNSMTRTVSRKSFLLPVFFFFCFSAFSQEQSSALDSGSEMPSGRLWSVIANLEELERSETVSLEDLQNLRADLAALDELLAASEATSTELQMQVDGALERYETLYRRFEKSQKKLSGWRAAFFGSSGTAVILIILLIVLL